MPLSTQITRDGESLSLKWGEFHVAAMIVATILEDDPNILENKEYNGEDEIGLSPANVFGLVNYGTIGNTKLNDGEVVLTKTSVFLDITDGEILKFEVGDVLSMWR